MVEGEPEDPERYIAPAGTVIETRIAARIVESILRRHFSVPEALIENGRKMSQEVASTLNQHFLDTHKLYWSRTHGNA